METINVTEQIVEGKMSLREKAKAKQHEREALKYISRKELLPEQRAVLLRYKENLEKGKPSVQSMAIYLNEISIFSKHCKKHYSRIDFDDIKDYVVWCRSEGIKKTTLQHRIQTLKAFFTWLKKESIHQINRDYKQRIIAESNEEIKQELSLERDQKINKIITDFAVLITDKMLKDLYLEKNKAERAEKQYTEKDMLMPKEIEKILEKGRNTREKCFVNLLWNTGCRVHELLMGRRKDLTDLKECFSFQVRAECKTGARLVKIEEFRGARPYITALLNDIDKDPDTPLFQSHSGNHQGYPLTYESAKNIVKQMMTDAKIDKPKKLHLFRHSTISHDVIENRYNDRDLKKRYWGNENSLMGAIYCHDDGLLTIKRKLQKDKPKEKIENKLCSVCSKEGRGSDEYCDACGGILLSKDKQQEGADKNIIVKLFAELGKTEAGKEAMEKALQQVRA